MDRKKWVVCTVLLLGFHIQTVNGSECNTCHEAKGVRENVPDISPIRMRVDGKENILTLAEAFRFHGHSCPGLTTTFRALQYGIQLLYGDEIPDRNDLLIFSKTPTPGNLDLLDLIMLGEQGKGKTVAPDVMKSSRENFHYILYRKSNCTAVDIRLKPELYPADFFDYKKKQSAGSLTPEEWETLHGYMKHIILTFPTESFETLFGAPKPYPMILWGLSPVPAHPVE
jgi:formylmethanofuran dehydrogenase subunit E